MQWRGRLIEIVLAVFIHLRHRSCISWGFQFCLQGQLVLFKNYIHYDCWWHILMLHNSMLRLTGTISAFIIWPDWVSKQGPTEEIKTIPSMVSILFCTKLQEWLQHNVSHSTMVLVASAQNPGFFLDLGVTHFYFIWEVHHTYFSSCRLVWPML